MKWKGKRFLDRLLMLARKCRHTGKESERGDVRIRATFAGHDELEMMGFQFGC
jgi:hypothetical protein